MKKSPIYLLIFLLLTLFSFTTFAWNRSIEFGYGSSHDPNNTKYRNSGFLLSGDFWTFRKTCLTRWSLNAALGQWHSTAPDNKNVTTGAVALALRLYPFTSQVSYPTYFLGSVGPALLSNRRLGTNTQGANITFQSNLGVGVEVKHFDVNLRLSHYSNANLMYPNEGFNILYVLSLGYLF